MVRIRNDIKAATRKLLTDANVEAMDSKLAHLIEAKQAITKKWRTQRLNRKLRKKIAELNKQIEQHCNNLCKQQWDEFCETIDGQIRNGKAWKLIKHLLDEQGTKSNQRHCLARAIHIALKNQDIETVTKQLIQKYLPVANEQEHFPRSEYRGAPQPELD